MRVVKQPSPPTGLARVLFRLPILLYRAHLGWLLGGRFLLLTHTGKKSGRQRRVVVEVVGGHPQRGGYVVCSGFGEHAAWYRNVLATAHVRVQVGRRRMRAVAEPLSADEGGEVMATYAMRNPWAARRLCRLMGFAVDGSAEDYRAVGERLPFVRFAPVP